MFISRLLPSFSPSWSCSLSLLINLLCHFPHWAVSTLASFLNYIHQHLLFYFCRVAVMSTASHTVVTQLCTAPVAEVRSTQSGCYWRAELTAAWRTTITIPLWWWPRVRKWVRRWQRRKTCIIKCTSVKPVLPVMSVAVSRQLGQ